MLHDNAGNTLLSSMSVSILKILKLISKSLQYDGDIFACISETLITWKLKKRKVESLYANLKKLKSWLLCVVSSWWPFYFFFCALKISWRKEANM